MLRTRARHRGHAPEPATAPAAAGAGTTWRGPLPFDFAASLDFRGQPGRIVQGVITIGPEAAFIATGISYAFLEDAVRPVPVAAIGRPPGITSIVPGDITLGQLPPAILVDGLRMAPRALPFVFSYDADERVIPDPERLAFRTEPIEWSRVGDLFQRFEPRPPISFLLSLIDSGTGRELQDEPIHNIASLGSPDGRRPFRPLARPMAFLPRSTVRVQAIERQADRTGRLDVVLLGYKVPATSAVSEEEIRRAVAGQLRGATHFGRRVIPFDYVAQVLLRGQPGLQHEVELPINVDGSFVATGISYALDIPEARADIDPIGFTNPAPPGNGPFTFDLSAIPLKQFPADALLDGIRLRPEYARLAFDGGGQLATAVRGELAGTLFERLNRPGDVEFTYRLFDGGAGRDLQNQRIFSRAGLGSADGQRPFRQFARPLTFEPRSSLRLTVDERRGRGVLHVVLQGYKRLGAGSPS